MDGREAGLNNDTLEAVFSFWKNNLGSELTLRRDTTHTTNQDPQIVIGFNVTRSGDSFSVSTPAKSWTNYQWASAGGYYHIIHEYTDQTPPTFTCNAAYDNIGTYYDNAYTTIAKALAAERNLFGRMADAIRYVNDSSSTINGQSIPNEIRALKEISPVVKTYDNLTEYLTDIGQILLPNEDRSGNYLGPDGNYYKYSCTLTNPSVGGNYTYEFYANYRFCVSKESKSTSWVAPDNMYLLSGAPGTGGIGNVVAFSFGTDQYTNNCSAGSVLIGQSMTLPPIKGTANNGTFPMNWSANISEAEANSYGIPVFNTNQAALEYVAQADLPAYINAQDFPQAIRELDPRYLAPNGAKYNYKISAYISSGAGTYNFYTDYPIFVCGDRMTSGKYYLESFLINIDNVDTIVEVSTLMGSYDANVTRIYPTGTYGGYSKRPCISYGSNEATCPYNWGINLSSQEVSDAGLTVYATVKDAYAEITGKYIGPDGNLYEYKWEANVYSGNYVFYSHYPFVYCTNYKGGDNYYLLTGVNDSNGNAALVSLRTVLGTYNALTNELKYPLDAVLASNAGIVGTLNGGVFGNNWVWAVPISALSDTEGFSTIEEAYDYITSF